MIKPGGDDASPRKEVGTIVACKGKREQGNYLLYRTVSLINNKMKICAKTQAD